MLIGESAGDRLRPESWNMSVCIASIVWPRTIVAVSDRMLSTAHGEITADNTTMKQWYIHRHWFVLFAASDTGAVGPVLRAAGGALTNNRQYEADEIRRVIVKAFDEERSARAESDVLGVYRLTMAEFLNHGLERFGEARFGQMCNHIDKAILDIDFLVCGFDGIGNAHIFDVHAGTPHDHDFSGYWAIGSGARLAHGALAARGHNMHHSVDRCVYNLCEARFIAESAYGVGRGETLVIVQQFDSELKIMPPDAIGPVKNEWHTHAMQVPPGALAAIQAWLNPPRPGPVPVRQAEALGE